MTTQCRPHDAATLRRRPALEGLLDACVWIEPCTGAILDCNAALPRLVGRTREQLVGQPVAALAFPGEALDEGSAWHAMAASQPLTDAGIRVAHRDGHALDLSVSVSPLNDLDDDLRCALGVWRDISRRRRTEVSLQENSDSLRAMAYEVTMAEARERERVAQGLHDDIGQSLALVLLKLSELGRRMPDTVSARLLEDARTLVVQTVRATRSATFDLSCPVLQQLGLQAAIESLGRRTQRLYGLRVHVQTELPPSCLLPQTVRLVVFRVVRELLSNVQRHARARDAWIRLDRRDDHLTFTVSDKGAGFDARVTRPRFGPEGGFGLYSAQAQMRSIGGRLDIDSNSGQGTTATVVVPLSVA